jgi:hypothetical protein
MLNKPPTGRTFRSMLPHSRSRPQHDQDPAAGSVYAPPIHVETLEECDFYHDMELPGLEAQHGAWDLRWRESEYLGGVDFRDKRVLELGTANGALGFWMEQQGAEVVCYDLSPALDWDIVPYSRAEAEVRATAAERKEHIRRLNNAWWLAHRLFRSKARLVHGDVYHVPAAIGPVDIVTFGAILLHLRDPFLALQNGLRLARETAVVVDLVLPGSDLDAPTLRFAPDASTGQPRESWWLLSPALVVRMLGVLGFEETRISYHSQKHFGSDMAMYTVVARRTHGAAGG